MDELFKKIIEKTELKNWTLFLFIFAISFTVGLRLIFDSWFLPDDKELHNTTLFLLEVFLSSLTITRILVTIKFLEAVNRTPILADFINWVVVERKLVRMNYDSLMNVNIITGERKGNHIDYWLEYNSGINEWEAWKLIYNEIIVEDELPNYKICKEAVINKSMSVCSDKSFAIVGIVTVALHPALYRHFDREKYGGFWIPKRPFCLEHFILAVCGGIIGIIIIKVCIAIGLLICRCIF